MSMTDREALDKAQKELDVASCFEETSPYGGLKAVHRNKIAWLARVLRLARKALYIEENQKHQDQRRPHPGYEQRQHKRFPSWECT